MSFAGLGRSTLPAARECYDQRVRLFAYRLPVAELEREFRADAFGDELRGARLLVGLVLVTVCGFIGIDWSYFSAPDTFRMALVARCTTALASMWAIHRLRCAATPPQADRTMCAWLVVVLLHMLVVGAVRHDDYSTLVGWDILVVFGIYAGLSLPLGMKLMCAMVSTLGSSLLWSHFKAPDWSEIEMASTAAGYLMANVFGCFVSVRKARGERARFRLLRTEQRTCADLEAALAEVKVLRDMIPICAFCKKIRNDEGYYEVVDQYLRKHSGVTFSHVYCPDCIAEHYPECVEDTGG